jgi:hypothetical protein
MFKSESVEFSSLKPLQVAALQTACRVLGMREARD